jgi:RNA polymerase sigma factor (sigma-70 family)
LIATAGTEVSDCELVDGVRAGDDVAFEALYRRYHPRIAGFVRGMLHDESRAEDVAQEAFLSALRRMRTTDAQINFKPWIYQIARNAAIDSYRRNSHAVEVSMDAEHGLRASDRTRLVGIDGAP